MSMTSEISYAASTEPELAPYKAICRSAVLSVVVAGISFPLVAMAEYSATYRFGDAVPLGAVGAALGLAALVLGWAGTSTTRRYPTEYTGGRLAFGGLVAGVLLFFVGASIAALTYATEVPDGYA